MKIIFLSFCCLPFFAGCQKKPGGQPDEKPAAVTVTPAIAEASGIADSRSQPGALWVIEDSGNPPQLTLLSHDGAVKQKLPLHKARNRDWEDVVLAGGNLYIGDIGDNNQSYASYRIYRLPEPAAGTAEITTLDTIRFTYADGSHDAEAFLVEPQTNDIYIITKRDTAAQVYKIAYPYSLTGNNVAEKVGQLSFNNVVSAALSPDGGKVLVKTYSTIYQYKKEGSERLAATLQRTPAKIAYQGEPQGEAVCFKLDGSGYFTLSEQWLGKEVQLFFYKQ